MDDRVRCITARRVRHILRSATQENVVPLHPGGPVPRRRPWVPLLRTLLVLPVFALLPAGDSDRPPVEPFPVAVLTPASDCGISKFRAAECDPSEYALEGLRGGQPLRAAPVDPPERLPVF
ncbi:MAG: hypothetical protein IH608_13225 [Proteobacteria bacterium]|nr:hypothetical protein [Pseudomonadota bacterium]